MKGAAILFLFCLTHASIVSNVVDTAHDLVYGRKAPNGIDSYVRWNATGVEPEVEGEKEKIHELISVVRRVVHRLFHDHRHATRGTHVKTQGLVKGVLEVNQDLPEHLAQGLFAQQKTYDVALRYANEPSYIQPDTTNAPRGLGLKVFGVEGNHLHNKGNTSHTHDFTFNNAPALELTDLPTALEIFTLREQYYDNPTELKARLALRKDRLVQLSPYLLPNVHPLSMVMYSQSAFRFGENVAKFALFPTTLKQKELENEKVKEPQQIHQWLSDYFKTDTAEYDLRVQLLEDLSKQSVEDCSSPWDEKRFPWQTVAHLTVPSQDSFDDQRRLFWEDKMELNVWYGLDAHKPLGSINRLRKEVYEMSRKHREERNRETVEQVSSIEQIP